MKPRKRDIWNDVTRKLEGPGRIHLPLAGEHPKRIDSVDKTIITKTSKR